MALGGRKSEIGAVVLNPPLGVRRQTRSWWLALAVVGITLLGAALRLVDLSRLPPGQYLDESLVNIIARDSVAAGQFHIYYPAGNFGRYHPAAVYLAVLGRWLTGGSPSRWLPSIIVVSAPAPTRAKSELMSRSPVAAASSSVPGIIRV